MKTDNIERQLQKQYKRYIRSIKNVVAKAELMTYQTFPIDDVSSRERCENISKATRILRDFNDCDSDLAIVNNCFDNIIKLVEREHVYENNNPYGFEYSNDYIYQHGRIGVYRALNKYNPAYNTRLITFISRNVFYELSNARPRKGRDKFCIGGLTDADIRTYWKMTKAYDTECGGDRMRFWDMYASNENLNRFKLKNDDDNGFSWTDFFELEKYAIWNVRDIYEMHNVC